MLVSGLPLRERRREASGQGSLDADVWLLPIAVAYAKPDDQLRNEEEGTPFAIEITENIELDFRCVTEKFF